MASHCGRSTRSVGAVVATTTAIKAEQIGELWKDITRGHCYFNSCNHDKEKYKGDDRLGIGMILRSDRKIRRHVHYAMRYLVKDDQQLRLKPVGAICLRMGQIGR